VRRKGQKREKLKKIAKKKNSLGNYFVLFKLTKFSDLRIIKHSSVILAKLVQTFPKKTEKRSDSGRIPSHLLQKVSTQFWDFFFPFF